MYCPLERELLVNSVRLKIDLCITDHGSMVARVVFLQFYHLMKLLSPFYGADFTIIFLCLFYSSAFRKFLKRETRARRNDPA